jgi:hypothetical protein
MNLIPRDRVLSHLKLNQIAVSRLEASLYSGLRTWKVVVHKCYKRSHLFTVIHIKYNQREGKHIRENQRPSVEDAAKCTRNRVSARGELNY